jgi:hypothetical protein
MTRAFTDYQLTGAAELVSPWFSNRWELRRDREVIAELQRFGRIHVSTVTLPDGSRWVLEPAGIGTVRALDAPDHEIGRIVRRSWWGRRWDIEGGRYGCELVSHPRPRRWRFEIGGSPIAEIAGSAFSYNRVEVQSLLALPLPALLLAWQVIARPWETAAAPRGLIPAPRAAGEGAAP